MKIASILVATDLSVQGSAAVQRAWQLAHVHGASLKMAYLPLRGRDVPDLVAQARGMDLVVLPYRHEQTFATLFRGSSVTRLLREARCPVLVTRVGSEAPYERLLVAVDFSPRSEGLARSAAHFAPDAQLQLFHAVSTRDESRLRAAEATEQAVRAYWRKCVAAAQERMLVLKGSFDARRNGLHTALGRGDPARQTVVQQQRSGADLVVVGKARSSAWRDFLFGSVAERVLRWGGSDVLVVPHARADATAPIAARRLATSPQPAYLPSADRSA